MRSYDAGDKYDQEELARLNAAPWMLEALALNPSYVSWGPREDYMWNKSEGWNSPVYVNSWSEFEFELDELNECCNFYFEIGRNHEDCKKCGGNGNHPDAQWITESFYKHSSPFKHQTPMDQAGKALLRSFQGPGATERQPVLGYGSFPSEELMAKYGPQFRQFCWDMRVRHHWGDGPFTEDEEAALKAAGRDKLGPLGHDAINRGILCEARCKRLGLPITCDECDGHGTTFTESAAHLSLVLWWMHPRKGATRGIEIKRIEESEMPKALALLAEAADRNADRFKKAVKASKKV